MAAGAGAGTSPFGESVLGEVLLEPPGEGADEHDVVHLVLGHFRVAEHLLDGVHGAAEEVHAELLETGAGDGGEEVDALEERVDLDRRLCRRREGALGALARGAQATHRTRVACDVLLVLRTQQGTHSARKWAWEARHPVARARQCSCPRGVGSW